MSELTLTKAAKDEEPPRTLLWSQVKASILALIRDESLGEHARLPSEHELCERFAVSRTVVREAMNHLVYEHAIYKIQGKGAFVAGRRDEQDFVGSTIGFSGELLEQHKNVSRRVLSQRLGYPNERIRRLLNLPDGDVREARVVQLSRVLAVDGVPRILVNTSIPEVLAPGLDQLGLQMRSLYDTLQRRYGFVFRRAERWLKAVMPSEEEAKHLEIATVTPLLSIESCAHSDLGRAIEHYHALYRTDEARLHIRVG